VSRFGVDYSDGRPSTNALKAAGVTFVVRYLSGGTSKDLTANEARSLSQAGIDIAVVWETTATRAEAGYDAGVNDARRALAQGIQLGLPAGRPIYFAVDEDTTVGPNITGYFNGVSSVVGIERTGVYGGYDVVRGCFDASLATFGWQTYAWSRGQWDSRAQLQQYHNGAPTIDGVQCDSDRAVQDDFGQWRVGGAVAQPPEDDGVVKALQRAVHVSPDGIWGPATDAALQAVRSGQTVRAIQAALGVAVDGSWGPQTDQAFLTARSNFHG